VGTCFFACLLVALALLADGIKRIGIGARFATISAISLAIALTRQSSHG